MHLIKLIPRPTVNFLDLHWKKSKFGKGATCSKPLTVNNIILKTAQIVLVAQSPLGVIWLRFVGRVFGQPSNSCIKPVP